LAVVNATLTAETITSKSKKKIISSPASCVPAIAVERRDKCVFCDKQCFAGALTTSTIDQNDRKMKKKN
jgi:hypothetical protein